MIKSLLSPMLIAMMMTTVSSVALCYESQPPPTVGTDKPEEFAGIGLDEKLGNQLDLSLPFTDEDGQAVTLGKYYNGKTPVVISPVYYACPGLCNLHLNGVVDALKKVDWSPGQNFEYVVVSFDPKDKVETAHLKKQSYMKEYERPAAEKGWHFLTATQATIDTFTSQVGFKYRWDEKSKQWAHTSTAIVTTPDGKIARYLNGIMFDPKTFKLAINEAGEGKLGTVVDKLVWYCFKYDTSRSKYTLYAFRLVQLGAILIIIVLGFILITGRRKKIS